MRRATMCACALLGVLGCRLEPGPTDYASQTFDMGGDASGMQEFLPGPDPYAAGESRLIFGPFYESAASDEIQVDDLNNFVFVFQTGGQSTLQIAADADRVEGFQSDRFVHQGTGFWGMSVAFFDGNPDQGGQPRPEDFSRWSTLHISLKSSAAAFANVNISMESSGGAGQVAATSYGYVNDGQWHALEIPLADLVAAGLELETVHTPLILGGGGGALGEAMLVDDFYITGE